MGGRRPADRGRGADRRARRAAQIDAKSLSCTYQRRTETVPPVPMETKYHPSAVDLHVLRKLAEDSKTKSLLAFFMKDFEGIGAPARARPRCVRRCPDGPRGRPA